MTTFNPNEGLAEYIYSAQTTLPFSFKVYDESNILLAYTETVTGVPTTTEIHQDDYTVTITGDQGGSIDLSKLPTPIPNGAVVIIKRNLPTDRTTQYQENGDLRADVLNEDQNYQTYLIQDAHLDKKYNLKVPMIPGFNGQLPLPQPGYYLQWNPSGTGIYNNIGTPGLRGAEGPVGPLGATGQNGTDGKDGNTGPTGPLGPRGPQGIQGPQGKMGAGINIMGHDTEANILKKNGSPGQLWIINSGAKIGEGLLSDGTIGAGQWVNVGTIQGQDGAKGDQGNTGPQGATGPDGPRGVKGVAGPTGPQGPATPEDKLAPIGTIVAFAGGQHKIPSNWAICDGSNGTPDLRGNFIMGAGLNDHIGDKGGHRNTIIVNHNHTITHTHKMNNHQHSINHNHPPANTKSAGNHTHKTKLAFDKWFTSGGASTGMDDDFTGGGTKYYTTSSAGNHHHSIDFPNYTGKSGRNDDSTRASSASHSGTYGVSGVDMNLPPYVKLFYIQRIS